MLIIVFSRILGRPHEKNLNSFSAKIYVGNHLSLCMFCLRQNGGLTGSQRKGCNFDFIDILLRDKTMNIILRFRAIQDVWSQKFSSAGSRSNQ